MSDSVSDFMVKRFSEWGVRRIFGYPGDGINGVVEAINKANGEIDFVQVRHEEMAAFMACAHAKFTSEVGVCLATSGPGAIHLLNGLYDAKMDHQPVVAIVGQQARTALGSEYQQEVDLTTLFSNVAAYVEMITAPAQARHVIDEAFRTALAQRTVACIIVPNDVQELDALAVPPRKHGTALSSIGYSQPYIVPTDKDLQHAAELLNAGEKVAILIGAGAKDATSEVTEVADLLGAGVAKALLGKAALPDDLPFVTGTIGLLGTEASSKMIAGCDTLLMVGTDFPYSEFLPKEGQARAVQIDIEGRNLGRRYDTEVNLVGDSAATLQALIPKLKRKTERVWREQIEQQIREWWQTAEARAMIDTTPMNPQRVFWELSSRLPDDAIICADTGTVTSWYALDVKLHEGMLASASGKLATMGAGMPYAIAAKFAYPQRTVIALVGDGAMQMNGLNELITVAKYWQRWANGRFIVLVLNNRDLNMVSWEQRTTEGAPRFPASQDLPDFPYAQYAELLGLKGIRVATSDAIGPAWDAAFKADSPVLIEALTDPSVPTLPPHITAQQAKAFAGAMFKGDPNRVAVIKDTVQQVLAGIMPGKDKG